MRLLISKKQITSTFNSLLDECREVSFAVAWASCGFDSCDQVLKNRGKIKLGVVGTHFCQTDPKFIESFIGSKNVKFIMNPSGVFHPKVYFFEGREGNWSCLIGSANFTSGGFVKNNELLVHIEKRDDSTGRIGSEVRNQIKVYGKNARYADEIDLEQYRHLKDRFKRPLDKSQGFFGTKKSKKNLDEIKLLVLGWQEFLLKVRSDSYLEKRVEVLNTARILFEEYGSLEKMPIKDRQGIGGFVESDKTPWGWFGSMRGAGVFKNLINKHSTGLSNALDEIPLKGSVQREDYQAFIGRYKAAFPQDGGRPMWHGLATATRLLAMKRPDYFVCLDNANRAGLSSEFGITINHHDYDPYWDVVIEGICESRWWNSRKPRGKIEQQIWEGRAAFLDAIYYSHGK